MEVDILCTRIDNGRGRCWRIYNCIETVTIILFELSVGTETWNVTEKVLFQKKPITNYFCIQESMKIPTLPGLKMSPS